MSFIEPDDYIILFDLPDHLAEVPGGKHQIPLDSLKRILDTGVKTILQLVYWSEIEASPGQYDWGTVDGYIAKARAAGMKTLLVTYDTAIPWAPPDWYLKSHDAVVFNDARGLSMISPWNAEAQAYSCGFIRKVIERYSAADVCCIAGFCKEGEYLLPYFTPAYFDTAALADFRGRARERFADSLDAFNTANGSRFGNWADLIPAINCYGETRPWLIDSLTRYVIDQQKLFAPAHREIWFMLHHAYGWYSGNFCLDQIYEAVRRNVDATLYGIQFTHFPHGGLMNAALEDQRKHGIQIFAGSEWAEGLGPHTPMAIGQGLRGLITAPMHPYTPHRSIEEWMIGAFRDSVSALARAAQPSAGGNLLGSS